MRSTPPYHSSGRPLGTAESGRPLSDLEGRISEKLHNLWETAGERCPTWTNVLEVVRDDAKVNGFRDGSCETPPTS
jgi:hypothetical protein